MQKAIAYLHLLFGLILEALAPSRLPNFTDKLYNGPLYFIRAETIPNGCKKCPKKRDFFRTFSYAHYLEKPIIFPTAQLLQSHEVNKIYMTSLHPIH